MLKEQNWMQLFYLPPNLQTDIKDWDLRGGADDGSLMGCKVMFPYLERLKPKTIPVNSCSSVLIRVDPPSIMAFVSDSWIPPRPMRSAPRPSQSTGSTPQPGPSTHTAHETCFNSLQLPIEQQRQDNHRGTLRSSTFLGWSRYRDKWGDGLSASVCF